MTVVICRACCFCVNVSAGSCNSGIALHLVCSCSKGSAIDGGTGYYGSTAGIANLLALTPAEGFIVVGIKKTCRA